MKGERIALMALAESWACDAGMTLAWASKPEALSMLTEPDAAKRALWRCAMQLAAALASPSGDQASELVQRGVLQPVQQHVEAPGS